MNETTNATETTADAAAVPEVKLSRREKLLQKYNAAFAKHSELAVTLQELASEINSIDALAAIGEGSSVIVTVGRGDDAKDVAATVIAVREEEDGGKLYKVTYGTGFDADIAVVKGNKLKLPTPEVAAAE